MPTPVERPNVKLETTEAGVIAHLVDCAALNEQGTPAVETQLQEVALEVGGVHLLVDFGAVHYASSAALAMLIGLYHRLRDCGGRLTVFGVNEEIYDVLEVTGLTRFIEIKRKPAEA